jgi:hypothetical protein
MKAARAWMAGAILVVLTATVAATLYFHSGRSGVYDPGISRLGDLRGALLEFAQRHGAFPREDEGLGALVKEGLLSESALVDRAGHPYAYSCSTSECLDVTVSFVAAPGDPRHSTSLSVRPRSPIQDAMNAAEEASVRDRKAFPDYADRVLNDFFHEHVMAKCIGVHHDRTPFMFAFVLDESGAVTKTLLNYDSSLGQCLVKGVSGTVFPRPPKAPFVAHFNWVKID